MLIQKWASHGITAISALFVCVVCGYGFASAAHGTPVVRSTPVMQPGTAIESLNASHAVPPRATTTLTPTPAVNVAVNPTGVVATWTLTSGQALGATGTIDCEASAGRPIVLVRALGDESMWCVQPNAELVEGTKFHCPVIIGNAATPAGTPFQVAIIVPRNVADERLFAVGATLNELPAGRDVMELVNIVRA